MSKRLGLFALSLFILLGICGRSATAQMVLPGPNIITTVAGNGTGGYSGDGGQATGAKLYINARGSAVTDSAGNLYIGDQGNNRIRRVDKATGVITTVAGNGTGGFSGDGGYATSAEIWTSISYGQGVAVDSQGNLFLSDGYNRRIRRVDASTGVITTYVGVGTQLTSCTQYTGDGGLATNATLFNPMGLAFDSAGNLYISDTCAVRKVDKNTGIITTYAGKPSSVPGGGCPDGAAAAGCALGNTFGITFDASDNLYIAEGGANKVRKVTASTGIISTIAGTGVGTFYGDGGLATSAMLYQPEGVAVDSTGNIYIADYGNNRIRKVDASTKKISTLVGSGTFSGDGGLATSATLTGPVSVFVDKTGNLFIGDGGDFRIRVIGAPVVPTTTTISSSDTSVYYGANVTFTATVSASTGTPDGSVTFYSDGSSIGTATLSWGSASITNSTLSIGTHSVYASYGGSGSFSASTSSPITQTITTVPTGIAFTTSPNPSLVTNAVNVQIQVTASNGQTPTGSVSVVADGSNNLGSPALSGGAASVSTSGLAVGTHSITVSYGGTALFDSSSVTQSQTVNKIPTNTSVNINPASANYGQCVTFTATVAATQGTATGTVSFTANATSLGTATLNGSAQASVQSCTLQAGTYTVTASYAGAANFATSSGSAAGFTVNKITPGLTWNTPAPIVYGTALSGTQLNASAGGVAGTYTYSPAAGAVLSAGSHTLTCNFVPTDTADYNTPAPVSVTLVVNKATPSITCARFWSMAYCRDV